jgi:hypothetical protein
MGPSVSAIVIGTTLPNRLEQFKRTVLAIESADKSAGGLIDQRIVSIDDFGQGLRDDDRHLFEHFGWKLILKPRRGMVKSQQEGLANVTSEWVFYCEDDVFIERLPSKENFEKVRKEIRGDRRCGIISMMQGGYDYPRKTPEQHKGTGLPEYKQKQLIDHIKDPLSYITLDNESVLWVREERFRDPWFIEFPVTFMRSDLMKKCSVHASTNFAKWQIEQGYTKSWFTIGFDKKFYKTTYMRDASVLQPMNDIGEILLAIQLNLIYVKLTDSGSIGSGYQF